MIKSNNEKKEEILKALEDLKQKGVKLTKSNVNYLNPGLYSQAEELFGSWMNAKNAHDEYIKIIKDPEKNLQRLLVKRVEELEDKINTPFIKNDKINRDFTKYVENNDIFLKDVLFNTFASWDSFYKSYREFATPDVLEFSEDELAKGLAMAISSDNVIEENVVATKYTDIYNAVVNKYGSLTKGLLHYLLNVQKEN